MFLILKTFGPVEGSSQGILCAFHLSCPRRKKNDSKSSHCQAAESPTCVKIKVDKDIIRRMFCLKVIFGRNTMLLSLSSTLFKDAILLTSKF